MPTEKEIQQARGFAALFTSNIVGIVISNSAGRILDANNYFLEMLGYPRSALERGELNWQKISSPDNSQDLDLASAEKNYFHKNGQLVSALVDNARLDEDTFITSVVVQRTQELQRSEAFLEAVFENNPNMIFVKDARDLRFVRFNRAGEQLLGLPRSQLIGRNDYDFFPREQADAFTSKDRDVLRDYRVVDIPEETIQTAYGVRFLHTKKIPVFNKDGRPEYLLGVSEDITEKKEAEKQRLALLEEKIAREGAEVRAQQMGFLSDLSLLLTETFDQEKILKSFGRKVVSFLSDICIIRITDKEDFDGELATTEITSVDPGDLPALQKWLARYPARWDVPLAAEECSIPLFALMDIPIQIRGQRPIGVVNFFMKSETRSFNKMDSSLAEEITRRLAFALDNSRLYFKAQEANRAKSAFLANVSHELRTPLGAMLGFAEILSEDETLGYEQRQSIQTVLRNGQQLLFIVNEILDISKAESERIQIENINFSLTHLLDDVIHLLRGRADQKNIALNVKRGSLPAFIRSDPTRLRQILNNVIGNAIKFTDAGQVEIEVRARDLEINPGHGVLEFQITDTGIGISETERAHLFQPFTQVDSSTTRRFGGTGLGLFLARKLARLLGGEVSLQASRAGQGSQFLINIVYEKAQAPSVQEEARSASPAIRLAPTGQNLWILIVDDVADNRELFKRYLVRLGIPANQIDMAQNGLEAVQMAELKNYQLILMDLQMPEMDGFQALAELKRRKFAGVIAALTAHAMKGDEEKCLAAGFDNYLQKPLSREALQKVIGSIGDH